MPTDKPNPHWGTTLDQFLKEEGIDPAKRRMIPVEEIFPEWRLDPEYVIAYADLKDEFDDALTRSFKDLVRQLIARDPEFAEALLAECLAEAAIKAHRRTPK